LPGIKTNLNIGYGFVYNCILKSRLGKLGVFLMENYLPNATNCGILCFLRPDSINKSAALCSLPIPVYLLVLQPNSRFGL